MQKADPGLTCLVRLLRAHGIAAEAEQIRHRLGTPTIGVTEMLRCAKQLGLRARAIKTNWTRLAKTPLPAIAVLRDGTFIILGRAGEEKILVQYPTSARPQVMTHSEFAAVWETVNCY